MRNNKQSARSLTAFLVTWALVVLTVTGIVLYVVPQGRIALWPYWSLGGLDKEQWAGIHMMFGGLFIGTGILHRYFNWKPFKKYLADRVQGRFEVKRALILSLGITAIILAMSIGNVPPVSWVFDLNAAVKDAWVSSPELEPPFGHAEEVSLAGIQAEPDEKLRSLAERHGLTPMDLLKVMLVPGFRPGA